MKLAGILFTSLLCAASAHAQYFSAGWTPGQKVADEQPPEPAYTFDPAAQAASRPAPAAGGKQLGFVDKILTSGPVSSLFGKIGLNMSEVIARGSVSPWDERIPIITDENYEEIIVNEKLTPEEEKERVWFLIVSVTSSQNSEISKIVDKSFDDAYNETLAAGDLPHVRWGRIDYMSVTYLTTKWGIWTGPYLIVLKDRGQTLRFYKADRVRISKELIRELLTEELWRETPVWNSNFAPGGKREFVLHYYGIALMYTFDVINRVPRFVLMIASGGIASIVMRFLHKSTPQDARPKPSEAVPKKTADTDAGTTVSGGTTAVASSTATSSPKKGKQRKNGKK
ncbi:hypothetical protein BD311DRAFT_473959 [Dichomitus squalens]|uniref:Thioredoxin-like protein n=1 Tax=Dichomitus squalens TaxID=114155 RepID=A0A4Q9MZX9_9APHY|nr:hypothetical protein BD311DRAFT_473959 [Dichomitus squalens]